MRLIRNLGIVCVFAAWISGTSLAQCPASGGAANAAHGNVPSSEISATRPSAEDDRTVLVELTLRKSGAVRIATAMKGPAVLREPAIKAVKKYNYKSWMDVWPFQQQVTAQVTFRDAPPASPEIRQVMPGGVPSCITAPAIIRITPEVMQSRLLTHVEPVLPADARPAEGTVILRVRIDKEGNVSKATKVSGPNSLLTPAIEAVQQWKYEPTLLNGDPVEVETTVQVKFPK
jgi:TonB family protein